MKLFFMNNYSATVALHKFRLQKNGKTGKEGLRHWYIKLVLRFEETGTLEDRVRSERPGLRIIVKRFKFTWPPRSPDLTPVNFWLWGFLGVLILSILSVRIERCDSPRAVIYTGGHSVLCRC
ncbi:hypothetical protein TNCV_1010961 [Trichonephila clavipes]|uniref:Uncharacterized protein n=1 Tax=Trichonephila clavipes TaxID=2585209 RepID=A0A8X6VX08_TRICX|nr:hypothetical protein TNCV_1010961 [Trichonephila clavipes]